VVYYDTSGLQRLRKKSSLSTCTVIKFVVKEDGTGKRKYKLDYDLSTALVVAFNVIGVDSESQLLMRRLLRCSGINSRSIVHQSISYRLPLQRKPIEGSHWSTLDIRDLTRGPTRLA